MATKGKGNEAALEFLRSRKAQPGPAQPPTAPLSTRKEVVPFKDAGERSEQAATTPAISSSKETLAKSSVSRVDSNPKSVHSRVTAIASGPANQTVNLEIDGKDAGQVAGEPNPENWEEMNASEKLDFLKDCVFELSKKVETNQEDLQLSLTAAFDSGKEGDDAEKHITSLMSQNSDQQTNVQTSAIPKWIQETRELRIKQTAMAAAWANFEQNFVRPLGNKVRELVALMNKMSVDDFNRQLSGGSNQEKPDEKCQETTQKPKKHWYSRKG